VTIRHDIEDFLKRASLLCEIKYDKPLLEMNELSKKQMEELVI